MARFVGPKRFLFSLLVVSLLTLEAADVKLRIYLSDGTLQAGNFVAETEKSFVILSNDGRVEIPKDKIIFINGKTLKQWQDRPDKLFQTEIVPSDVPDPKWVNKQSIPKIHPVAVPASVSPPVEAAAAAPALPSSEPVKAAKASTAARPARADAAEAMKPATEASATVSPAAAKAATASRMRDAAPVASERRAEDSKAAEKATRTVAAKPVSSVSKVDAAAPGVVAKPEASLAAPSPVLSPSSGREKPARSVRPRRTSATVHQQPPAVSPSVSSKAASVTPPPVPNEPTTAEIEAAIAMDRARSLAIAGKHAQSEHVMRQAAAVHLTEAQQFERRGDHARALTEYHLANTLDRASAEAARSLGRLYAADGVGSRAKKFFAHPALRKQADVATWVSTLEAAEKEDVRHRWWMIYGTLASLLAWVPMVLVSRRLRRSFGAKPASAPSDWSVIGEMLAEKGPAPAADASPVADAPELERGEMAPAPAASVFDDVVTAITSPDIPRPAVEMPWASARANTAPELQSMTEPAPPLRIILPDVSPPVKEVMPPPPPSLPEPVPASVVSDRPPESPRPPADFPKVPAVPSSPSEREKDVPATRPPSAEPARLPYEQLVALAERVQSFTQKGNAAAESGEWTQARRGYHTALALQPTCVDALLGLAYADFCQENIDRALQFYRKVVAIDPKSAAAHYGIGRSLCELGLIDEAVPALQAALSLDPTFEAARESLTALGRAA